MNESRGRGCGCGTAYLWLPFFAGWFVYGSWKAGLVTLLILQIIFLVSIVSGIIPLAGPFVYWFIAETWIMPLFPRFGLEYSWLTELFFWLGLIIAVVDNCIIINKIFKIDLRLINYFNGK